MQEEHARAGGIRKRMSPKQRADQVCISTSPFRVQSKRGSDWAVGEAGLHLGQQTVRQVTFVMLKAVRGNGAN